MKRLINSTGYLLQHVASLLARQSDQVLQEQLGIGMSQFKILRTLQARPQTMQREIALHLGQTEASISRQVKLMMEAGLLRSTVSPHNRREHLTELTAKGERLTEVALDTLQKYHAPTFGALDEDAQKQLHAALETLHQQICSADHPNPVHLTHPKKF